MTGMENPWHLDKRVNVSIIFAVAMQTCIAIWWASNMSSRQSQLEAKVQVHDAQIDAMRTAAGAAAVSLARIEENVMALRSDIARLANTINP